MATEAFTPYLENGLAYLDKLLEVCHLESNPYVWPTLITIFGLLLLFPIVVFIVRKVKPEAGQKIGSKMMAVKDFVAPGEGPRFRKRDRLAFMGRKVFRNAKAVGSLIRGGQVLSWTVYCLINHRLIITSIRLRTFIYLLS
jgi:hypothetical protein